MNAAKREEGAIAAGVRLALAVGLMVWMDQLPNWTVGVGLVVCVWLDALAGMWMKRRGAARTRAREGAELLADFGCFAVTPAMWIMQLTGGPWAVKLVAGGFVLAAAWRLVRFHAEGLTEGRYRGLPTTYCGYAVPMLAGVTHLTGANATATWLIGLTGLAWAMNSGRIRVPEF